MQQSNNNPDKSEFNYELNNSQTMKKYGINEEFAKKLDMLKSILQNPQNFVFIFHDSDSDGLCSYLLLKNSFSTIQSSHFITKEIESQQIALEQIPEQTTHIVCVDTPSVNKNILNELCEKYRVIILDHHLLDNKQKKVVLDLETQGVLSYINPLNYNNKDPRPITYFCYLLSQKSENDIEFALVGTVADFFITPLFIDIYSILNFNYKSTLRENNVDGAKKISEYPLSILFNHFNIFNEQILNSIVKKLEQNPLYFLEDANKNENANHIQMLTFSTQVGKLKFFFDFIFKNTTTAQESIHYIENFSLYELLGEINSASQGLFFEFDKYYNKYQKIIQSTYEKFNASKQPHNYIIVEHKGKTSYNRQLSEQILYEKDVSVVFSMHQRFRRGFISGSFRSKPHINLHLILQKVFEGIEDAKWGGHENACGCSFSFENKELVVSRFIGIAQK